VTPVGWLYVTRMQVLHSTIDESLLGCPHAFFFYARLSDLLVVANSSLNVFIYCCFSQHFSRAVRGAMAWRRQGAATDDSLDSRRETISCPPTRPPPPPPRGEAMELVARGGQVSLLLEQASASDCEGAPAAAAAGRRQGVTTALTHGRDSA